MPYAIRKVGKKFQVVNTDTGEVHAKGTTKQKAEAQIRLLGSKEGGGPKRGRSPPPISPELEHQYRHLTSIFENFRLQISRRMLQERPRIQAMIDRTRAELQNLRNPTPAYLERHAPLTAAQMLKKEEKLVDGVDELLRAKAENEEYISQYQNRSRQIYDELVRVQEQIDEATNLHERLRSGQVWTRQRRNSDSDLEDIEPNESEMSESDKEGKGMPRRFK